MIKTLKMIKDETLKKETRKIFFEKHGYMPLSESDWAEFKPTEEAVEAAYGIQLLLEIRRVCATCPGVNVQAIIYKDLINWSLFNFKTKNEIEDFITYLELMYQVMTQGLDEPFDSLKVADYLSNLELAFTGDMKIADIYAIFF